MNKMQKEMDKAINNHREENKNQLQIEKEENKKHLLEKFEN